MTEAADDFATDPVEPATAPPASPAADAPETPVQETAAQPPAPAAEPATPPAAEPDEEPINLRTAAEIEAERKARKAQHRTIDDPEHPDHPARLRPAARPTRAGP